VDRGACPDHLVDALVDGLEALSVGVGVLQRVVVLVDPNLLQHEGVVEFDQLCFQRGELLAARGQFPV
jgi:hypothetical protein